MVSERPLTEGSSTSTGAGTPWTAIYAALVLVFLARIAIGYVMGIHITRVAEEFDRRSLSEFVPGVRYRSSPQFKVPMTFGWIFPVVLLPREFATWNAAKRRAVLAHEHAHVRRRDFLTNLLASLTRAIHWMNPLAWWLERHLAHLAEQVADEIAAGRDRRTYAEFLIEIAESAGSSRIRAVAMARSSGLGKRIENLSNGRNDMTPPTRTRTWTLTLGILALVGAASCMTPTRAASGASSASFTEAAQEEAESREIREQELRALEAELERARAEPAVRNTAAQVAERAARAAQDVDREFERQRALEELELQRGVARQRTLEELRRLREVEIAHAQQVSEARQAYERARATFTEEHPAYVAAQARLEALQAVDQGEQIRRLEREVERVRADRDRVVGEQSIEDQIREAERQITLVRAELQRIEDRLRTLVEQRRVQESN